MHILSMTHEIQVANRDRGGKINEKAQVWLGHFISCLFQALGHFIEHLVCIGGTKSKPTTPLLNCG